MSPKTKNIIGWVLSGLLCAMLIMSAFTKFTAGPEMLQKMKDGGLSPDKVRMLGVIEILCSALFLIPRTGVLGLLLLTSYIGGIIATDLQHDRSLMLPVIMQAVLWIAALLRFPEIGRRLMGQPTGTQTLM